MGRAVLGMWHGKGHGDAGDMVGVWLSSLDRVLSSACGGGGGGTRGLEFSQQLSHIADQPRGACDAKCTSIGKTSQDASSQIVADPN